MLGMQLAINYVFNTIIKKIETQKIRLKTYLRI